MIGGSGRGFGASAAFLCVLSYSLLLVKRCKKQLLMPARFKRLHAAGNTASVHHLQSLARRNQHEAVQNRRSFSGSIFRDSRHRVRAERPAPAATGAGAPTGTTPGTGADTGAGKSTPPATPAGPSVGTNTTAVGTGDSQTKTGTGDRPSADSGSTSSGSSSKKKSSGHSKKKAHARTPQQ